MRLRQTAETGVRAAVLRSEFSTRSFAGGMITPGAAATIAAVVTFVRAIT